MSTDPIVLTDVAADIYEETFELSADSEQAPALTGSEHWSIRKHRMRGGLSDGVDVVDLDNGVLSVSVLPTRGMGFWRGDFGGVPLGWDSPVTRPVNPMFVNLEERDGLGWLGGFNELLCRCGLAFNGPPGRDDKTGWPMTLHGRIANRPAEMVAVQVRDDGPGTLRLLGIVEESMMFGGDLELATLIETEAGSNTITISDKITNRSASAAEWELLYHVNLGRPFLGDGSRLVAPPKEIAPRDPRAAEGMGDWNRCLGPTAGYAEQVYFMTLAANDEGLTRVLLKDADGEHGVSLAFRPDELPCFSYWKNTQPEADGYVAGLEPGVNWPNFKPFERNHGRVRTLAPDESVEVKLALSVHIGSDAVSEVESEIQSLAAATPPQIHSEPGNPFSPPVERADEKTE